MRTSRTIFLLLFLLTVAFSNAYAKGRNNYGDFENVSYVRNYDGDTITFDIHGIHPLIGEDIEIRVRGIDTPEIRGKCEQEKIKGRTARKLVESLLRKSKSIRLKDVGREKYFRILADVEVDGKDLADVLIKNNLAVPYEGGAKIDWCSEITSPRITMMGGPKSN